MSLQVMYCKCQENKIQSRLHKKVARPLTFPILWYQMLPNPACTALFPCCITY